MGDDVGLMRTGWYCVGCGAERDGQRWLTPCPACTFTSVTSDANHLPLLRRRSV